MKVRFVNLGKKFSRSFFKKVIEKVLKAEKKESSALTVVFLGPLAMRKLNFEYRQKNRPTDVLTFPAGPNQDRYLGETLICLSEVRKNAKIFDQDFEKETKRVLIHGLLHLFGYDHERESKEAELMIRKQESHLS
ncbi:MAG: rRNA maturation RNase YbeY [bacterium]|nr:rRNA maturation RNase YbeY [bacterium]